MSRHFYITLEILGSITTSALGFAIWYYSHSWELLVITAICLIFISFGNFAWRDRIWKEKNNMV